MKKVLIFQGGWEGHQPRASAELFAGKLRARGFAVDVRDTLACLDSAAELAGFSLIVPMWTMGGLTPEREKNLVAAVRGGTGLAGFHGGMGDAFRGSLDYEWMVGGHFVAHPDNLKEYTVRLTKPDDPILRGLGDFTVRTEHYYMLVDPANEVLATSTVRAASAPWADGVAMPVVWKKRHGAGRVFYSALGHVPEEFSTVPTQLELTLRGMEWAAR